jgi:putative SOS response-associated peptidase YedK
LQDRREVLTATKLVSRYNVCPTDPIDVVTERDGKRDFVRMRWGLVEWWWLKPPKDTTIRRWSSRLGRLS